MSSQLSREEFSIAFKEESFPITFKLIYIELMEISLPTLFRWVMKKEHVSPSSGLVENQDN